MTTNEAETENFSQPIQLTTDKNGWRKQLESVGTAPVGTSAEQSKMESSTGKENGGGHIADVG